MSISDYPTYIINAVTYSLWTGNAHPGESYREFLERVYHDFDVLAKCVEMQQLYDVTDFEQAAPRLERLHGGAGDLRIAAPPASS